MHRRITPPIHTQFGVHPTHLLSPLNANPILELPPPRNFHPFQSTMATSRAPSTTSLPGAKADNPEDLNVCNPFNQNISYDIFDEVSVRGWFSRYGPIPSCNMHPEGNNLEIILYHHKSRDPAAVFDNRFVTIRRISDEEDPAKPGRNSAFFGRSMGTDGDQSLANLDRNAPPSTVHAVADSYHNGSRPTPPLLYCPPPSPQMLPPRLHRLLSRTVPPPSPPYSANTQRYRQPPNPRLRPPGAGTKHSARRSRVFVRRCLPSLNRANSEASISNEFVGSDGWSG